MSDDWGRNQQSWFLPQLEAQRELQRARQRDMDAQLSALQEKARKAAAAQQKAMAEQTIRRIDGPVPTKINPLGQVPRPLTSNIPWQNLTPSAPQALTEGSYSIPLASLARSQDIQGQWIEAREELQTEREAAQKREEARMLMRDALNAGVASGLFTQERALAIIALTGINNQPFPREQAKENIRLAFRVAAEAGAVPSRVGGLAWKLVQDALNDEPDLDLPADAERYEELLYEVLTIRPCHLPEHLEWHLAQTICAAHRGRISQDLLDALSLVPRMLPRAAHQDQQGRTLECCQNEATERWLDTGLTDFDLDA